MRPAARVMLKVSARVRTNWCSWSRIVRSSRRALEGEGPCAERDDVVGGRLVDDKGGDEARLGRASARRSWWGYEGREHDERDADPETGRQTPPVLGEYHA
jgi:hypothetical protein